MIGGKTVGREAELGLGGRNRSVREQCRDTRPDGKCQTGGRERGRVWNGGRGWMDKRKEAQMKMRSSSLFHHRATSWRIKWEDLIRSFFWNLESFHDLGFVCSVPDLNVHV